MSNQHLSTNEFLALEYLNIRQAQFNKLPLQVKVLILEIVQYYLSIFYATEHEATSICSSIILAIREKNELDLVDCYKQFLEFLPVRIRAGVQGKNLFRQPSEVDVMLAHFYENDIDKIKEINQALYTKDEFGLTPKDRMIIMQTTLEQGDEFKFEQ